MEEGENLRTLAEVAIALAGFTGVVAVLGRRASGAWPPLDLLRLHMLLATSVGVLMLSFIPALLEALNISGTSLWQIANFIQLVIHSAGLVVLAGRVRKLDASQWPRVERLWTLILIPISLSLILAQLLNVLGALAGIGFFIYFSGLLYLLLVAVLHFVLLLVVHEP
jgi:hypothetical protein